MLNVGKWIARHRVIILIAAIALLFPSALGYLGTRTNYDMLSYLPESLETVEGQNILVDEFGMGAFSMIVVEDMDMKDAAELEKKIEAVPHVANVLWYDDAADISLPVDMLPDKLREAFFNDDATMMIALLDDGTSADTSLEAIDKIREVTDHQCYVSGMTALVNDIKNLCDREVPVYVTIAVILALIILLLTTSSYLIPFLFLASIGMGIVYNMGTNVFFGEISYITKALAAVLQLGVTMDYSIFLFGSYEETKLLYPESREEAMGHAIVNTFRSIVGSSVTTIAGFIALCFMTFTLGLDLGIVMAKGVVFGVITCVTVLPALILIFDEPVHKLSHTPIIHNIEGPSRFITRHYKAWIIVFLLLLVPAVYGNNNVKVYYNILDAVPETLDSKVANRKLEEKFNTSTMHMLLIDKNLEAKDKVDLLNNLDRVDGVKYSLGMNSLVSASVPEDFIPEKVRDMLQSDSYELVLINSEYPTASNEVNAQLDDIVEISKSIDPDSILIGEAPLTKDLMDITAVDFINVNSISIIAIFVIILLVLKSISLPVILIAVIEFAIMANMAASYYTGATIPFIASVVLGTIQLGSTVDYAILMTNRYIKERSLGAEKKEAVDIAHNTSMLSILTSGCSFFAAVLGVGVFSEIDMLSSLCTMLARGALISMVVVIMILPAMLMVFDGLICHTTVDLRRTVIKKQSPRADFNSPTPHS